MGGEISEAEDRKIHLKLINQHVRTYVRTASESIKLSTRVTGKKKKTKTKDKNLSNHQQEQMTPI